MWIKDYFQLSNDMAKIIKTPEKRNYLLEILTDPQTERLSGRRFIALGSFFVLVALVILEILIVLMGIDKVIDRDLIYVFASLCLGQSGLTVFGTKFRKTKKEDEDEDNK